MTFSDVLPPPSGHEQVLFCQDPDSGLNAIIGIYSTALGPALGGIRVYPYASEQAAVDDVLNLSKGMAYKSALARLPLGGGKAVIIGDPASAKSDELLAAFGRFVDSLGGRYITACDVGTDTSDMDVIATQSRHVTGRSAANGGTGDPSAFTAHGVLRAMLACAQHVWGEPQLVGRRVGVAGVGKVGHLLVGHLVDHGASVVVTDVRRDAVQTPWWRHHDVQVVASEDELVRANLDIYAPCALGGAVNDGNVDVLNAAVVCGAANNQLSHPDLAWTLHERGILYAPDYVVNAGGLIHAYDELHGYDAGRVKRSIERIFETTKAVLEHAARIGVPPSIAADRIAERRLSSGHVPEPSLSGAQM